MPQPPLSENTEGFLLKQTFLKIDYHYYVYYNPEKSKICGCFHVTKKTTFRGGSRTAPTSKMDRFVMIVNSWKLLTIITKRSILDVAAVLDPLLTLIIL